MRKRESGETEESFINNLKKMVRQCEYGDQKDRITKDRIICGITNKETKARLLEESKLTLELVVKISSREFADELSITGYKVEAINRQSYRRYGQDNTFPLKRKEGSLRK